jgi:hypothetical protein
MWSKPEGSDMRLRDIAACAAVFLLGSCGPQAPAPSLPPAAAPPGTSGPGGGGLPPEQAVSNLDIATIRVAGPSTNTRSSGVPNHRPVGLLLLVKSTDLLHGDQRNLLVCGIFFAVMQVPPSGVISPDERVSWWLDKRDPPPTTSNCADLVTNYDYPRALGVIQRLNLTGLGQGPILVKQAADNASAGTPGAWFIDASTLPDENLVALGKSWVSVVGNEDDPKTVATAIANIKNPSANADAANFWGVFQNLWNWLVANGQTIGQVVVKVATWIVTL